MNVPVEERYEFLHNLVDKMNVPFVSVVKSKRCTGAEDLQKQLEVCPSPLPLSSLSSLLMSCLAEN